MKYKSDIEKIDSNLVWFIHGESGCIVDITSENSKFRKKYSKHISTSIKKVVFQINAAFAGKMKIIYYYNLNNQNFYPFCLDKKLEEKYKVYLSELVSSIQNNYYSLHKFILENNINGHVICIDGDNENNILTDLNFYLHDEVSTMYGDCISKLRHRYVYIQLNKYSLDPTKTGHMSACIEHFRRFHSKKYDYILLSCPISPSLIHSLLGHGFVLNSLSKEYEKLFCLSISLSNEKEDMEINKFVDIEYSEIDVYKRKFSLGYMSEFQTTVAKGYPNNSILLYYIFNEDLYDSSEK